MLFSEKIVTRGGGILVAVKESIPVQSLVSPDDLTLLTYYVIIM